MSPSRPRELARRAGRARGSVAVLCLSLIVWQLAVGGGPARAALDQAPAVETTCPAPEPTPTPDPTETPPPDPAIPGDTGATDTQADPPPATDVGAAAVEPVPAEASCDEPGGDPPVEQPPPEDPRPPRDGGGKGGGGNGGDGDEGGGNGGSQQGRDPSPGEHPGSGPVDRTDRPHQQSRHRPGRGRPVEEGERGRPPEDEASAIPQVPEVTSPGAPVYDYQPIGNYSTDGLMPEAVRLRRAGVSEQRIAREAFAPFIIAGPASWTNTWGAPRYGPAPGQIRTHEGQDVFCRYGDPVLASEDGTIEFDEQGLGGLVARLHRDAGGYWYYAHLSARNDRLADGDAVRTGDIIGYCGNSGNAATTPSHVHFGWYGPDGVARDPMSHLVGWLREAAGARRIFAPESTDDDLEISMLARHFGDAWAPHPSPHPAAILADLSPVVAEPARRSPVVEEISEGPDDDDGGSEGSEMSLFTLLFGAVVAGRRKKPWRSDQWRWQDGQ